MKKLLLLLFLGTISTVGFSQSAGKGGSEKSGGLFSRMFKKEQKPHAQQRHFDKPKKDPNMKHNGTSYGNKSKNKVDGDGFAPANQTNNTGTKKRKKK
jgi:hypothetical protein